MIQQESSTASFVKTVTTHMWMKLAALLKLDCQSTGGTAETEKLRDQAWHSIPLRKTTGLTGKAALSKEKKLVKKKSEGGSPHPQTS